MLSVHYANGDRVLGPEIGVFYRCATPARGTAASETDE